MMIFDSVAHEINRHIGTMEMVVGEIFLDHIALVTEANNKVCDPVVCVMLHNVPQDRPFPDLDHGLRADTGLLGEPSAPTARQNDALHLLPLSRHCLFFLSQMPYRVSQDRPSGAM